MNATLFQKIVERRSQAAYARYNRFYDEGRYHHARGDEQQKDASYWQRGTQLREAALALCGHPFHKFDWMNWTEAEIAYLSLFLADDDLSPSA